MPSSSGVVTFLFTDIEGSTRLWEQDASRMQAALGLHDAIVRRAVEQHRGTIVKTTGDGVHAAFDDPLDAIDAALQLQLALGERQAADDVPLAVRCGIHLGVGERRDDDYYGRAINRAARIMNAAHGGQVLVSQAVAAVVAERMSSPAGLRDLGEMRLRDLASAERIFQLTHPRLRADFPALRALVGIPTNLAQQLTSFVGRERELADVVARIPQCRLLTLTGPGGIGKTRLSLQAAADVMDQFGDGVYLVEFAPVSDARMVPQAVASALGVKEEVGHSVVDALVTYVRDRQLLLIFDNCEHLVQACADLATALLRASAGTRIVASSREPLRVAGESTFAVPSLSVPEAVPLRKDGSAKDSPAAAVFIEDVVRGSEAARLFIERASAARADFQLTHDNAVAIVDICRRLDGIPLAIELAAACTRTMSAARIEERLSDRFRLLSAGDRSALPRQQTLRALIDWSYDLLSDAERALLRRLSVFAGGFTLEAAEAIGKGSGVARADVLPLLSRLVEKSLVANNVDSERYWMLETVRQYALDRLHESEEDVETRDRHLDYHVEFANRAMSNLSGAQRGKWFAAMDAERENLLRALAHCDHSRGGAAAGMQIAHATKFYWFSRGQLELGYRICTEALTRSNSETVVRIRALLAAGQFASWLGRYDAAFRHLEQGLAIARSTGETKLTATILQPLGLAALGLGKRNAARSHLEEALVMARQGGDKHELAAALNQIAMVERIDGRTARAAEHYAQALALARELGDSAIVAVTLLNLAIVAIIRSEAQQVPTLLREVLGIAGDSGDRLAVQGTLDVCAALASMRAEYATAARFYGMAERQLQEVGMQRDPVDAAFLAPWIATVRHELAPAVFDEANAAGRMVDYDAAVAAAYAWLDSLRA